MAVGAVNDASVLAGAAAGISLLTLLWSLVAFILTRSRLSGFERRSLDEARELANREQHRREINDGTSYLLARDDQSRAIGLTMLEELQRSRWTTDDDRAKVAAVIRVAKER